jgi:hypothetical protein
LLVTGACQAKKSGIRTIGTADDFGPSVHDMALAFYDEKMCVLPWAVHPSPLLHLCCSRLHARRRSLSVPTFVLCPAGTGSAGSGCPASLFSKTARLGGWQAPRPRTRMVAKWTSGRWGWAGGKAAAKSPRPFRFFSSMSVTMG